jgi:hypothetical protein
MDTKIPKNTYDILDLIIRLAQSKHLDEVWKILSAQNLDVFKRKVYKKISWHPLSDYEPIGMIGQPADWDYKSCCDTYIRFGESKQLYMVAKIEYLEWLVNNGVIAAYGYKNKHIGKLLD